MMELELTRYMSVALTLFERQIVMYNQKPNYILLIFHTLAMY